MQTPLPQSGRTIERELSIEASPEQVFRALTEKADLERWFVSHADIDLRPGGAFTFTWKPQEVAAGTFLVIDPPHRLVYTYAWDTHPPATTTTVAFELTAEGTGTRLRLIHTGIGAGEDWDYFYNIMNSGWSQELAHLRLWLQERKENFTMTLEENKQVVQRFHEQVWNQRHLAVIDELVSPDYRMHMPLPTPDREGLRQFVSMIHGAFPDWHETIEDVIAEGDRVVLRGIIRGTQQGAYMGLPPTGKPIRMTTMYIFRLAEGKIVEDWGEADSLGMMQQLGALPQMG